MYNIGDYVFAGTQGHLPYPAKITKIQRKKGHYHVSFINYKATSVVELSALEEFNQSTVQRYRQEYEGTSDKEKRGVLRSIKVAECQLKKSTKGINKKNQTRAKLIYPPIKIEIEAKYEQNNDQSQIQQAETEKVKLQNENIICKTDKKNNLLLTQIQTKNKTKDKHQDQINIRPKLEYIETISSKQSSKNSDILNYESSNIRSLNFNQEDQIYIKHERNSQKAHQLREIDQIYEAFQSFEKDEKNSMFSSLIEDLNYIENNKKCEQFIQVSSLPKTISNLTSDLPDFEQLSSLDDNFSDDESTLENVELNREMSFDPHTKNCLYFTRNLEEGDQYGLMEIMDQKVKVLSQNDVVRKMQTFKKYLKIQLRRLKLLQMSEVRTQNPLNMHKRQIYTSIIYDSSLKFEDFVEHNCILLLFDFIFKYQESSNKLKQCLMGEYFMVRSMLNIFFVSDKWKNYVAFSKISEIQKQVDRFKNRVVLTRPL